MRPCLISLRTPTMALLGLLAFSASHAAQPVADIIYTGGDIVTVNELQPSAEAVAVRGGKIAAVGYRDEIMKLKGPKTKVIDLGGKTMIPGLIDAHGHVYLTGIQALRPTCCHRPMARAPTSLHCGAYSRTGQRRIKRLQTRSAGSSALATTTRSPRSSATRHATISTRYPPRCRS